MKRCPECRRDYTDETLNFCLDDGSPLLDGPSTGGGLSREPETAIMHQAAPSGESATRLIEGSIRQNNVDESGNEHADAKRQSYLRRKILPIAAFGLIVLTGLVFWMFISAKAPDTSVEILNAAQVTDWPGLDDFAALSPDGKSVAYSSDHGGSFEIYVKPLTAGAREIQVTSDGTQNLQPTWSPDGSRLAYHSVGRDGIWVIPASGGDPKQLTEFGTLPAWSPDGTKIAFQSYPVADLGASGRVAMPPSILWTVSAAGGEEPKQLTKPGNPAGGHGAPSYSPDGKFLVFEVDDYNFSSVWCISSDGLTLNQIDERGFFPAFSPAGDTVIYMSPSPRQVKIDKHSGRRTGQPRPLTGNIALPELIRRVSFSADGKRMAYNTLQRHESLASIHLTPGTGVATGSPLPLVEKMTARTHQPAFSSDGKRITFSSCPQGGYKCDIWIANSDGSDQTQLTTAGTAELLSSWLPGGSEVLYTSSRTGRRSLWAINLNTKRERPVLDIGADISYYSLSPDGRYIAFNMSEGNTTNVGVVPLEGGEVKKFTADAELAGFPAWSPDGKWIGFQVKRGDDTHIMVMPSVGGPAEQITSNAGHSWLYSWAPDSDRVTFAGFRDHVWNVYWISRTTKKEQQVTDYKKLNSFARYPSWSPLGDQIIYEYSETRGNVWVADLK